MRKRFKIEIDEHIYERITDTIRNTLLEKEKDRRCIVRIVLAAEDVLKKLLDNRNKGTDSVTFVPLVSPAIRCTAAVSSLISLAGVML